MKKVTIWLTATAAAIALVIAYQLNVAGVGGKEGGDRPEAPAAATASATGTPAPSTSASTAKSDSDGANTDHTGKPGENK